MILPLFIRTLSEFFCFSREVSGLGLYGRRSSTQSTYFLIINILKIAAKVRAVELAGGKSQSQFVTPAASLLWTLSLGLKGHQNFILLEHRGHLLARFGCRKTV